MITCTVPKPSPTIQSITMLIDLPSGSSLSYAFVGEERVVVDEDIPAALLLNIEDVRICAIALQSLFSMPFNFTCINEGVEKTLTILVSRKKCMITPLNAQSWVRGGGVQGDSLTPPLNITNIAKS